MKRELVFTLPIAPQAWQRVARAKAGHTYVPYKTMSFKQDVGKFSMKYKPVPLFSGPLSLTAKFYLNPPKQKIREYPSVRPDIDNYLKALMDACNGVLWEDDAQVVQYGPGTGKFYCMDGSPPRIEITLKEI